MLKVIVRQGETIDKAIRRYRRKVQSTKMMRELRRRKQFVKPSIRRRNEKLKAIHREKKLKEQE